MTTTVAASTMVLSGWYVAPTNGSCCRSRWLRTRAAKLEHAKCFTYQQNERERTAWCTSSCYGCAAVWPRGVRRHLCKWALRRLRSTGVLQSQSTLVANAGLEFACVPADELSLPSVSGCMLRAGCAHGDGLLALPRTRHSTSACPPSARSSASAWSSDGTLDGAAHPAATSSSENTRMLCRNARLASATSRSHRPTAAPSWSSVRRYCDLKARTSGMCSKLKKRVPSDGGSPSALIAVRLSTCGRRARADARKPGPVDTLEYDMNTMPAGAHRPHTDCCRCQSKPLTPARRRGRPCNACTRAQ